MLSALVTGALAAETPKRGGILKFVVGAAGPPHFDGHQRTTFALLHPIGPFYSVLIRVNPDNPSSVTNFVVDLFYAWLDPRIRYSIPRRHFRWPRPTYR